MAPLPVRDGVHPLSRDSSLESEPSIADDRRDLSIGNAHHVEVDAQRDSTIHNVDIYLSSCKKAEIVRRCSVRLVKGVNVVTFRGLPTALQNGSLRYVSLHATAF